MSADLLVHSLVYGGVLSVVLGILVFASMAYNYEIWLHDFPPDIQARYGPASAKSLRERKIFTVPFMLLFFGIVIASALTLPAALGRQPAFWELFLSLYIVFMTFNLVDLLLFDWLFGIVLKPERLVLPGTEGLAGYRDYGFHFRGFLKGSVMGLVASLLIAGIVWVGYLTL